jgi:hypothetical protein
MDDTAQERIDALEAKVARLEAAMTGATQTAPSPTAVAEAEDRAIEHAALSRRRRRCCRRDLHTAGGQRHLRGQRP